MHELSLCQQLCRILQQEVASRRLSRVIRVEVSVGSLSCVSDDALAFCFDAIDKSAALASCQLVIHRAAAEARCRDCGSCYPLESWLAPCPACGSLSRDVCGGSDMIIEQMEAY